MKKIVFILLLTIAGLRVNAEVTMKCNVRFKERGTWSQYSYVNVKFLSGSELGQGVANNLYAIIYWGNTNYIIQGNMGCGTTVITVECLKTIPYNLDGRDNNNNEWSICFRSACNP